MIRIKAHLSKHPHVYLNKLLWAACCTGFAGFLRVGEFLVPDGQVFDPKSHLCLADILLHKATPQWFSTLTIKVSKTDQFRSGAQVVLGASGSDLCPVAALLDYLSSRGGQPGPLFILEDGTPLSRAPFARHLQAILSAVGLDGSRFNTHSFRIGAATSASQAGVPESTIQALGRWHSTAYQRYIRPTNADLAKLSQVLC